MARTSAKAKKSKQEVNKKKEEAKKLKESQNDSEGSGESTDKENDSANYDVEKITHTRIYKGKRQYLVRWKGYSEDDDTWETESALQSCKEILDAFKNENLGQESADDENEAKETPENKKGSKKSAKKSEKKSVQKRQLESDEEDETEKAIPTEKAVETESKVKGKKKKKVNEKETKGKKRKSIKDKDVPVEKKSKTDDSSDESVTDGKDYEVEKILEVHTRRDGTREFLIRWKGYKPSDDTWEPEAHLDCQELIEKFMDKVDKAKDCSRKELRQRTQTKSFVPLSASRVNQRNSGLRPCYTESVYED